MTSQKNNYVPTDYEDLYRYYILGDGHGNSLCHQIIRSMLPYSNSEERDDLAHLVVVRCIEKDMLKVFDPAKANFGGVIFFVTRTIVANHLSRKSRNPLTGLKAGTLTDMDVGDWKEEPGVYSLDRIFLQETPDPGSRMDLVKTLKVLAERCKALADNPKHTRDRSLFPLLKLLLREAEPEECSEKLGVTPSTIHNWTTVLRKMVEDIKNTTLGEKKQPLPPGKMLPIEE